MVLMYFSRIFKLLFSSFFADLAFWGYFMSRMEQSNSFVSVVELVWTWGYIPTRLLVNFCFYSCQHHNDIHLLYELIFS